MKRVADAVVAACALVLLLPWLGLIAAAIFCYDLHSPFYIATRVGKGGQLFKMVKFRSMAVNADKNGVTSTAANDRRITPIGHVVRRYKLDELVQLWNVLLGHMSLVGPRPNVPSAVAQYTPFEMQLLKLRPGVTDFASIVFADEGEILKNQADPDVAYNQLIRPWKSRLGIFYIQNASIGLDLELVSLTALAILSRDRALRGVHAALVRLRAPADLAQVALRQVSLEPLPPPGSTEIVTSRQ
jgi:lipopolysaccharide/colanic/teichoic acid biosynthesis glycosyltransferase